MLRPYLTSSDSEYDDYDDENIVRTHEEFRRRSDAEDEVEYGTEVTILKHFIQDKYSWERR